MLKQRIQSSIIMFGIFSLIYFFLDYIFFEFLVLAVGGFLLFELSKILKLHNLGLAFFWFLAAIPLFIYFISTFTSNFGNFFKHFENVNGEIMELEKQLVLSVCLFSPQC